MTFIYFIRPTGFTSRKWSEKALNKNPFSYEKSPLDPFYYQRAKWWHEEKDKIAREAWYRSVGPGKKIKKFEILVCIFALFTLVQYFRYLYIKTRRI